MKNLYIDFDGVILDTINETYTMMKNLEIDMEDEFSKSEFYKKLDWDNLLSSTSIINDAFDRIERLLESSKFDIAILTHINSLPEAVAKVNYIRKYTKEVTIIPVPREISKTMMCQTEGSILVDDYSGNLKEWEKSGGIGIQFSTDLNKDKGFKVIDKLDDLIDMF